MRIAGPAALTGRAAQVVHDFLCSRCLTIAGGTSEVLRNLIAERIWGCRATGNQADGRRNRRSRAKGRDSKPFLQWIRHPGQFFGHRPQPTLDLLVV
nr:acyl-CoA dehydrogenase family protein [Mycobacterium sp. UM_CSW]